MNKLKKAWTYIKNYWYIPVVIILGIFLYLATRNNENVFFQMFKEALERNRRDLEEIEKNNLKAAEEKQAAKEKAAATIEKIKNDYKNKVEELEEEKKKRAEELIKNSDDPEVLAKELSELTGWKYIPPKD